jgi:hypothetical protein
MDYGGAAKLGGFGRFSSWTGAFRDEIALAHRRSSRPKTLHAVCYFFANRIAKCKKIAFRFK